MDRLSAYYAWNDPQSLQQALLVAAKHQIDLTEIETWSEQEGELEKYKIFLRRLKVL
jgi:prephenate dehydratase